MSSAELIVRENIKNELERSLKESFTISLKEGAGFAVSRFSGAGLSLGLSIMVRKLKDTPGAISGASPMFNIQQGFMGATRGFLSTTNVFVRELIKTGRAEDVGKAIFQSYTYGVVIGTAFGGVFIFSKDILSCMAVSEEISNAVGQFLRPVAYGVIPTNFAFIDQMGLLTMGKKSATTALNVLLSISSVGAAGALAFKDEKGLAGLGWGLTIGAVVTWAAGRGYMYFGSQEGERLKDKYGLFNCSTDSGISTSEYLKLALPTALQAISEWTPTLAMSVIIAASVNATINSAAIEPSMQLMVFLNQVLMGLSTAATVEIAGLVSLTGQAISAVEHDQLVMQTRRRAMTNLLASLCFTVVPGLVLLVAPKPFVNLFSEVDEDTGIAETAVRYTGATFLFDGLRNVQTGNILGKKMPIDNVFSAVTNLLISTGLTVLIGQLAFKEHGLNSYPFGRLVAIGLTFGMLLAWWSKCEVAKGFTSEAAPFLVSVNSVDAPNPEAVESGLEI